MNEDTKTRRQSKWTGPIKEREALEIKIKKREFNKKIKLTKKQETDSIEEALNLEEPLSPDSSFGFEMSSINSEDFDVVNAEGHPIVDSALINELDESTQRNNPTMENQQCKAMLDQVKLAELAVLDKIEDFSPEDLKASNPSEYKN